MDVGSWKNRSCNDGSGVGDDGKVITMKLIIVFVVVSVILMVMMVVVVVVMVKLLQ